jgi:hypothetical protein
MSCWAWIIGEGGWDGSREQRIRCEESTVLVVPGSWRVARFQLTRR